MSRLRRHLRIGEEREVRDRVGLPDEPIPPREVPIQHPERGGRARRVVLEDRCGLPVVTTFDPDNLVAREGMGKVVSTIDELVMQLRELPKTPDYARMSFVARNFFQANYSIETVSRQFRLAFEEVVAA